MGLAEIQTVFARCKADNRPALMPYWPLGFPDAETSLDVVAAIVDAGADMLELGVPFSDPLADGPIIQHASQVALEHGMTVQRGIDLTRAIRQLGITVPILAMGYLNPLLAYGERSYVEAWREAGADGFIVPDLPPEESAELAAHCAQNQMALVSFTAPTSTEKRIELAVEHATGFIYVVAVTGVTGARDKLASGLREYVQRVRAKAGAKPIVVGFGISTAEHVREVGQFADGVIVASALIRAAGEKPDAARIAHQFVRDLQGWKNVQISSFGA